MKGNVVNGNSEGKYQLIGNDCLIQVVEGRKKLDTFSSLKIYVYDLETNKKHEIMPEVVKYNIFPIYYAKNQKNYFVFISAELISENEVMVDYYFYNIADKKGKKIHSQQMEITKLYDKDYVKVFVLEKDYCMFQVKNQYDNTYKITIRDIEENRSTQVKEKCIVSNGIDKIFPLSGNMCCFKIGCCILGIININQFISDMVMDLPLSFRYTVEQAESNSMIRYVKMENEKLLYIRVDNENRNEEAVSYDYKTQNKSIRLNITSEFSDFDRLHIINDVPYSLIINEKGTRLYDLNTQKVVLTLQNDAKIRFVSGDVMVISRIKKIKIIPGRKISEILAYKFPDMEHEIFRTKGKYNNCFEYKDGFLLIAD